MNFFLKIYIFEVATFSLAKYLSSQLICFKQRKVIAKVYVLSHH